MRAGFKPYKNTLKSDAPAISASGESLFCQSQQGLGARSGQALIVILMICLVLGILAGGVFTFQSGQTHLLSKSASDFMALGVAEAGLHTVLSEMRADYQFSTHGSHYVPMEGWKSPSAMNYNHIAGSELLKIDGNERGTYSGTIRLPTMKLDGKFKVRMKLLKALNSVEAKTVSQSHRYFLLESVGQVKDSYRLISTVIEKIVPGNYLFYDGQVLDLGGYGPYRVTPGEINQGRLYGHELIVFSRRGTFDRGIEFSEMEKIYTPGHIRAESATHIGFSNHDKATLTPRNDSTDPEKFETHANIKDGKVIDYYLQDGYHGGKPQKLPQLNPDYWRKAKRPAPKILRAGSSYSGFSESKWRNPLKPAEVVYDLFFGWEYQNKDDKVLLYSEVPLRIWGCPPYKALTIFCEKDVYIAGDFNANPENPQNYTAAFKDYTRPPRNGTDKNGVAVMSMGRIWFDYSNPMLFLRNEMRTLIDYDIAMALGGEEVNPLILAAIVFPPRMSTGSGDSRKPMTIMHFPVLKSLFNLPKQPPEIIPITAAGIGTLPALSQLRDYLRPSANPEEAKNRFALKSSMKRSQIYARVGNYAYMTGTLTRGARDRIIDSIMDQAQKEIEEGESDATLGPWNAADRIFQLAIRYPRTGFKIPEMTVNAMLIDSSELNARWASGNGATKVRNELGNIESPQMQSFPFIGQNSRFIIKHLGSMIHLRNRPEKLYISGSQRNDQSVVRRNSFDATFVPGSGDYFPPYPMAGFTLINWTDRSATPEEFNSF